MRYILLALAFLTLSAQTCEDTPVPVEESHDWWFAVIDSMESRWGMHWEHSYDTQSVFNTINDFGVDFVISTGDNVACDPSHPAEATHCYLELKAAMAHYLDVPVYFVAGNHDLSGTPQTYYNPPVNYTHVQWEEYIGPLDQEFTHKGAHFVLVSDGDAQMTPFYELYPERTQWYCDHITPNTLAFRHMVHVGYTDPPNVYFDCELNGGVQAVFFGHYGTHEDYEYEGTRYIQTADAKDGAVRFVHVVNGQITEMVVVGPTQ